LVDSFECVKMHVPTDPKLSWRSLLSSIQNSSEPADLLRSLKTQQ